MEITCTLMGADIDTQLNAWADLGPALRGADPLEGGLRLWFDAAVEARLRDIAAKEADCCAFLTLAVAADGDAVRLDVTSDLAEARPVIDALGQLVGAVDR